MWLLKSRKANFISRLKKNRPLGSARSTFVLFGGKLLFAHFLDSWRGSKADLWPSRNANPRPVFKFVNPSEPKIISSGVLSNPWVGICHCIGGLSPRNKGQKLGRKSGSRKVNPLEIRSVKVGEPCELCSLSVSVLFRNVRWSRCKALKGQKESGAHSALSMKKNDLFHLHLLTPGDFPKACMINGEFHRSENLEVPPSSKYEHCMWNEKNLFMERSIDEAKRIHLFLWFIAFISFECSWQEEAELPSGWKSRQFNQCFGSRACQKGRTFLIIHKQPKWAKNSLLCRFTRS